MAALVEQISPLHPRRLEVIGQRLRRGVVIGGDKVDLLGELMS